MNLRIEGTSLRFRVAKEELEALCAGGTLTSITPLPDGASLEVSVIADGNGSTPLTLQHDTHRLTLHAGKKAAADLLASLPNREGMEATQRLHDRHALHLVLEVDIRSQKRKRP